MDTGCRTLPRGCHSSRCPCCRAPQYAFAIGHVAAFDMERGVVSPGGVGFDISCVSKSWSGRGLF